jgi:superfamily II DNA/RNA helicase
MSNTTKNQREILAKLGIATLNEMQEEAKLAISSHPNTILLSPTGTGKTLAFLLPIIATLNPESNEVQVVILAPSRELAIQISQVTRDMGTGFKVNEVYGGRNFSKDKINLQHRPAILVGTPGRIADHLRRKTFETNQIKTLVLDEFDKSLEVGFEEEMKEIVSLLPKIEKRVLTSATKDLEIPQFVNMHNPLTITYLADKIDKLAVKRVLSPSKDKLDTLLNTISLMANQPGIIFCNFKNTIQYVSDFLNLNSIPHGCFYGGMEQKDRERALIKFRNGTHQILIATDLAARGIDVPEIKYIIHYQLPFKAQEFTHRNGRTARMHAEGTAFVLQWEQETIPDFIAEVEVVETAVATKRPKPSGWKTLFISGGRKDKISKGDIAGLFMKQGKLQKDELGMIELKQDCAFVAVKASKVKEVIQKTNNTRLKKKKVRVSRI